MRAQTQRMVVESESSEGQVQRPISTCYVISMCSHPFCQLPVKSRYHGLYFCKRHFAQQYMRDKRGKPTGPTYFTGALGEAHVRGIFTNHGRNVIDQPSKCKFDFLVDGWRVEVKTVNPWTQRPGWLVNFQRNGVLDEQTDFYVVRLQNDYEPIHILLPAPVRQKSMYISRGESLWQRNHDFQAFCHGDLVSPNIAGRFTDGAASESQTYSDIQEKGVGQ